MHLHQRHGEHCHDAQPGREDRDPLLSLDEAAQVDVKEDVFEQVEGFPEVSPPAPNANHRIHSVNWWLVKKKLRCCGRRGSILLLLEKVESTRRRR